VRASESDPVAALVLSGRTKKRGTDRITRCGRG
jgi:hypothetical protein